MLSYGLNFKCFCNGKSKFNEKKDSIIFRCTAPRKLAAGTHAGFAVSLIDIDSQNGRKQEKRLCFTESGAPNECPAAWASIVLMK